MKENAKKINNSLKLLNESLALCRSIPHKTPEINDAISNIKKSINSLSKYENQKTKTSNAGKDWWENVKSGVIKLSETPFSNEACMKAMDYLESMKSKTTLEQKHNKSDEINDLFLENDK